MAGDGDRGPEWLFELRGVNAYLDGERILADVDLEIPRGEITALIGPTGAGKTTLLRCLNRMTELTPNMIVTGRVIHDGRDLSDVDVDPAAVRRRIGMVFQRPHVLPMSIFKNVAFGARGAGLGGIEARVERALARVGLWEAVEDRLDAPAERLTGVERQLLCIARVLALEPEVILIDEPGLGLDVGATAAIEELLQDLKRDHSIVLATNDVRQAARVSDMVALMLVGPDPSGAGGSGRVIEFGSTEAMFTSPADRRTEAFLSGRGRE
jgi:phosphate transport system ATP-binding protein